MAPTLVSQVARIASARAALCGSADAVYGIGSSSRCSAPRVAASSTSRAAFSTSSSSKAKPRRERPDADDGLNINKMDAFMYDDISTLGHEILDYNREFLRMFRLVELELPRLARFRAPFQSPLEEGRIVQIKVVHHQGDTHVENKKAVLTVDVGALFEHPDKPLKSRAAKHKFLLLAGERYDPFGGLKAARERMRAAKAARAAAASSDASQEGTTNTSEAGGINGSEQPSPQADLTEQELADLSAGWWGQVKIASDRFPNERMNARWCFDTLGMLIEEANFEPWKMADVPLDPRRQISKDARAHAFARSNAVSIRDFPKEWL